PLEGGNRARGHPPLEVLRASFVVALRRRRAPLGHGPATVGADLQRMRFVTIDPLRLESSCPHMPRARSRLLRPARFPFGSGGLLIRRDHPRGGGRRRPRPPPPLFTHPRPLQPPAERRLPPPPAPRPPPPPGPT